MKKTIILMLMAVAAFSFTACDSLIPNDPSTEEENTQGSNGNPGGTDGTEDETPTIVPNQKIVKYLSDEDGNIIYSFEYDDKDRLVRYSFRGENLMSYEYEDNKITATPLERHPYTYDFHFDDKGYLVSWDMLYDGKISETFTMEYKDGFLVADPGGDFRYTYVDGNLISTYNTDGSYGELAYYDILYDLNIDIQFLGDMYYIGYCGYDGYLPVLKPLPGITSRNCLKRATRTDADGSILDVEYEYTLDSDGNISKIKLSGMMTYITNGIQHEAPLGEGVLCVKY